MLLLPALHHKLRRRVQWIIPMVSQVDSRIWTLLQIRMGARVLGIGMALWSRTLETGVFLGTLVYVYYGTVIRDIY